MKKYFLVAILTYGLLLISCTDNIDNNGSITPVTDDDNYTIVVDEGMTMPENEFETLVPAVAGDPAVVCALKAIDGVMDVKPFEMYERYDYYADKIIMKTAYYFNFKQLIDHNNPTKGWFKQQCVLTLAGSVGNSRPTVLHTEGYALEDVNNRLDNIREPMLVSVLNANCLQVEYRYHGWSLPEGWTNNFNYLTAKQHSDDLHAIVTAIKQSGLVAASSKWVSTGVSKNGMTTAHYAYHYPNEMDAYVPFCAPFLPSLTEKGPSSYCQSEQAFGDHVDGLARVKAAFRAFASDKALQAECVQMLKKDNKDNAAMSDEAVLPELWFILYENYFGKLSYVEYAKWEPLIPQAGDPAEKFYAFIMADEKTKYTADKQNEYARRLAAVNDLEPDGYDPLNPFALTRAVAAKRYDAYYVQTCIDLGNYVYDVSWVDDLITESVRKKLTTPYYIPTDVGVNYDNGQFVRDFFEGMKQSSCHMMFVYGMQDPWTGGQIPDDKLGPNSQKLFIQNGIHNDYIDQWNDSERNKFFDWLKEQGFDL